MIWVRPARALVVVSAALVGVGAFTATRLMQRPSADTAAQNRPIPAGAEWDGRQILVVLIGSSSCRFASDPSIARSFWSIVQHERVKISDTVRVNTVGVGIDDDPGIAVDAIQAVGQFDEYDVGNGWLGVASLRYMVRDLAGAPMVPQVLIVSRRVHRGSQVDVGPDSLHVRLAGVRAITQWAARVAGDS